ncbi:MAG: replication initiator protein A [Pseudomonadota bacterium]
MSADKSPLLPLRHEPDFFVCDVFDSAFKGDRASMEHPIFTLSKKPDMTIRKYEHGDQWCEVRPSVKGRATVFDRDVIIYCISQCMKRLNDGLPVPRTLRFKAYDLLVATNRDVRGGGRSYKLLREALERLQGTQIATNIVTGGNEQFDVFSLIDKARIVKETRDGRMQDVEITLSDWVFNAIEATEVLTLDKSYFQLARPLERRLYELARKHCGEQREFKIKLATLHTKTGSQSTLREFKRLVKAIIDDDEKHDHFPTYRLTLEEEMIIIKRKAETPSLLAGPGFVSERAKEEARRHAPGWDIYALEDDWRSWVRTKKIQVENPDAHFVKFCKSRGAYKNGRLL